MFSGQQVEFCVPLEQMEGARTPLWCVLMGSDVCMCIQCCVYRLGKCNFSLQVLIAGNNGISLKADPTAGFYFRLSTQKKMFISLWHNSIRLLG